VRILTIINTLTKEGVSSDESDVEEGTNRPIYRVRVLLWRRDFDWILDAVDKVRFDPSNDFNQKGALPRPRVRQDRQLARNHGIHQMAASIKLGTRRPVPTLPLVYYDNEWYDSQSAEYVEHVLSVSKEAFEWVRMMADLRMVSRNRCVEID
jgi:hypothetical protein